MQHRWTDEEGIKNNFCIKCGLKKSATRRRPCNVSADNWKKNIKHQMVEQHKDYYGRTQCKCKICGIEANKRWSHYSVVTIGEDLENVFVAYIEKTDDKGKVVRRCYTTNTEYQRNRQEKFGREIKFWLVGCAYTEDEAEVRDIIL
jgi:hypothetical protein